MATKVTCSYCKKEFEIKDSQVGRRTDNYCTRECYNLARRKYVTSTCINCNNEFKVRKNDVPFKKFCCEKCGEEFNNKINNKRIVVKGKCSQLTCKTCNKKYWAFGRKANNYCSNDCKNKVFISNAQVKLSCKECGIEFFTHRKDQQFCSVSCASKTHSREQEFGLKVRPQKVWNKNLNKENDIRIQEMSIKIAIGNAKAIRKMKYTHGYYNDIGHYVRSGWEANFARILIYLNRKYDYEPNYFKLSNGRTYTPDFYDYKNNNYYEIKGRWMEDAKEKFELFKQEYPQIKIKLIEERQYKRIIKFFKNKIILK